MAAVVKNRMASLISVKKAVDWRVVAILFVLFCKGHFLDLERTADRFFMDYACLVFYNNFDSLQGVALCYKALPLYPDTELLSGKKSAKGGAAGRVL